MVAFASGLHVADEVVAFTAKYPHVEVDLMSLNWWEQDAPLRDGRADVGFELIASGHDIALVPEPVARSYPRADLVYLPIADAPPSETCFVTTTDRPTDHLLDFVALATESLRA